MSKNCIILGGGISGLAAGIASGFPIFEKEDKPGGICSSYYMRPHSEKRLEEPDGYDDAYRFEFGGGHWIFGGDTLFLQFLRSLSPVKFYLRKSAVFFPDEEKYVPYPLQNHLSYLGKKLAAKAIDEMINASRSNSATLENWLYKIFGQSLTKRFFGPFHELYTAGFYREVAPQDSYKTPIDVGLVIKGAFHKTPEVGYNARFVYPKKGLDYLTLKMSEMCNINYKKQVVKIDIDLKKVYFKDGTERKYDLIISTLPLNKMIKMTDTKLAEGADPHASVLVLNIGAKRGQKCPHNHWLYIPKSRSGFHRVGFYSNVDASFLPRSSRKKKDRVSLYIERSFKGGEKLTKEQQCTYKKTTEKELQQWGLIEDVEVNDATWIEVAYTFKWPGSNWRDKALNTLQDKNIYQTGRYGKWRFQGISDSIRDGFLTGAVFNSIAER